MKPNVELTQILNHFQPHHLEETIKGNKSARKKKKKKNVEGNIDMNNKCESSGAFKGFSTSLRTHTYTHVSLHAYNMNIPFINPPISPVTRNISIKSLN